MGTSNAFQQGFGNGSNNVMNILSYLDSREDRKANKAHQAKMSERQDTLFLQSQADRAKNIERGDVAYEQGQTDRTKMLERDELEFNQGQTDRESALNDAEVARIRAAEQHPLMISALKMENQSHRINLDYDKLKLTRAKQEEQSRAAQQALVKAGALLESGDPGAAMKAAHELEKYGYDVPSLAEDGGQQIMDTMTKVLDGKMAIDSDEVQEMAKTIFKPTLVQSGRSEKYDIDGVRKINKDGKMMLVPYLRNKETGEVVPATQGMSGDPKDPVAAITPESMVQIVSNHVGLARDMKVLKAQLLPGAEEHQTVKAARIRAETDANRLEFDKQKHAERDKKTLPEAEADRERIDRFVNSYEDYPDKKALASVMSNDPNFDPDNAAVTIDQLVSEANDQGISPQAAYQKYQKKLELHATARQLSIPVIEKFPQLNEEDVFKLFDKARKQGGLSESKILELAENHPKIRRSKRDEKKAAAKAKREEERALNPPAQRAARPTPTGPGQMGQAGRYPHSLLADRQPPASEEDETPSPQRAMLR